MYKCMQAKIKKKKKKIWDPMPLEIKLKPWG
jgi:hypothetical protein